MAICISGKPYHLPPGSWRDLCLTYPAQIISSIHRLKFIKVALVAPIWRVFVLVLPLFCGLGGKNSLETQIFLIWTFRLLYLLTYSFALPLRHAISIAFLKTNFLVGEKCIRITDPKILIKSN